MPGHSGGDRERQAGKLTETRWLELPRDTEAPFYRSPSFSSSEETFIEIHGQLSRLLDEIPTWRHHSQTALTEDRIKRLHRRIFRTTFPEDAGRFRRSGEDIAYGVLLLDAPTDPWRFTQASSAPPEEIQPQLRAAHEAFEAATSNLVTFSPTEAARPAAQLFIDFLKTHPFIDGNLRSGVAILQIALQRLGQRQLRLLPQDIQMAIAISHALRPSPDASTSPLINLITQRISPTER